MSHLTEDELLLLLAGESAPEEVARARAHLKECSSCSARLAREARVDDALNAACRDLFPRTSKEDAMTHASAPYPRNTDARCDFCGVGLPRGARTCPACDRPIHVDGVGALPMRLPSPGSSLTRPALRWAAAFGLVVFIAGLAALNYFYTKYYAKLGTVVVTVTGANQGTVRFDDRPPALASPSVTIEDVKVGAHTLVVEAPGHATFTTTVVTTENTPLFALKAPLKTLDGTLHVMSVPSEAEVYVDGEAKGTTPLRLALSGGQEYRVRVQRHGYEGAERTVRVQATSEQRVHFDLRGSPPVDPLADDDGGLVFGDDDDDAIELKRSDVLRVVKGNLGRISECGRRHASTGIIKASWQVELNGSVSDVAIVDDKARTDVGACVAGVIKRMKFPPHQQRTPRITFPFKLD